LIVHDILGMLAFFILIGAQFAGVIVVHRWQAENRSTEGRQSGSGLKPLQAAVVKSDGGERCSQRREDIPAGEVERGERKRTADELSKAD
jgi:hypothetical protein